MRLKNYPIRSLVLGIVCLASQIFLAASASPLSTSENEIWKFDLGNGELEKDFTKVTSLTDFSDELGYGLICPNGVMQSDESKKGDALTHDCVSSSEAFYFQFAVPEGRYKVSVTLGSPAGKSGTTVKAENRRLMLENVQTKKGESVEKTFIVDVRNPYITKDVKIKLKAREYAYKNWDNYLTLEFNGENPSVSSIVVEEANDLPVIFLAGNSTVTDQSKEPWASWGQMFPGFLKPNVVVANFAESGETLRSFKGERRLRKLLSVMKPGDYLFMEFAHNDQKPGRSHVEPYTTYQEELRFFISEARKKGGKPVLVTSTNRRRFDEAGNLVNTLDEYPNAMRQLAKQENIPLIDLNASTKVLYEAFGVEDSKNLFAHYPANTFPGQTEALADNTHFNAFGAYELAKCVVQEMLDKYPELAKYVLEDFGTFDPAKPDSFKNFFWPLSPEADVVKPEGS